MGILARTASSDGVTLLPKTILGVVAFYAIFILIGALLAFYLTKVRVKRLGYNPSDIDNVFLVAFPMGLVGARVWYCAFQFHEFNTGNFWTTILAFLGIQNGHFEGISGLAIQGGVLFGVVSGMLFVHKYRKNMRLLDISDSAVPTILLAQAIGRIGNFFNGEVYGHCVDASGWSWLGQWFVNQMSYDGSTGVWICNDAAGNSIAGQMALPLWLIEALINIAGYFIITRVLQLIITKKKLNLRGAVTFSYFVWYGIVRLILEPLRNPKFIMSVDNSGVPTSRITAIVFIIVGLLLEGALVFNNYYLKKKNKHIGMLLAQYASWFDSLNRTTRIILTAIPVTGWLNAIIYRLSKDNFTCGVLCVFVGPIFWIIDLVTTISKDKITVFADGKGLLVREAELEAINEAKIEETKKEEK